MQYAKKVTRSNKKNSPQFCHCCFCRHSRFCLGLCRTSTHGQWPSQNLRLQCCVHLEPVSGPHWAEWLCHLAQSDSDWPLARTPDENLKTHIKSQMSILILISSYQLLHGYPKSTSGLINRLYSNGNPWGMHFCPNKDLLYCKVFQQVICAEEKLMSGTLPINSPLLVIMF